VKVQISPVFCRVELKASPVFLLSCERTDFSCVLSCEGTDFACVLLSFDGKNFSYVLFSPKNKGLPFGQFKPVLPNITDSVLHKSEKNYGRQPEPGRSGSLTVRYKLCYCLSFSLK